MQGLVGQRQLESLWGSGHLWKYHRACEAFTKVESCERCGCNTVAEIPLWLKLICRFSPGACKSYMESHVSQRTRNDTSITRVALAQKSNQMKVGAVIRG